MSVDPELLLQEAQAVGQQPTGPRPRCQSCASQYKEAIDLMLDNGVPFAHIEAVLARRGFRIGWGAIRNHARHRHYDRLAG